MVVVAGRVVAPGLQQRVVAHDGAHAVQPVGIGAKGALLLIGQTVESHILLLARAAGSGEGIGLSGLHGNLTPLCLLEGRGTIDGHSALVELLTVAQHILAHLAEVDIEVATMTTGCTVLTSVDEGVEHPELHIFYISLLKVGGLQLAHHAAPLLLGVLQRSVAVEVECQVIRSALLGIVGQVEDRQRGNGAVVARLVAVGIELSYIDLTHIVVGELLQVVLDMCWREARRTAREDGVDVIPGQQGALVAAVHRSLVVVVGKHRRHAAQHPRLGVAHIAQVLGILEVVDIRGIVLCAAGITGYEVGKLSRERYLRGLRDVQQRQFVEHLRQPLALLFPVHVESPDGVVQRLVAHVHLGGHRLLGEVHQRTSHRKVLREVVLPVHAQHGLSLHAVAGIVFERHADVGAGIDDALVQDGHLAHRVVDGIVGAFLQGDTASSYHHRS